MSGPSFATRLSSSSNCEHSPGGLSETVVAAIYALGGSRHIRPGPTVRTQLLQRAVLPGKTCRPGLPDLAAPLIKEPPPRSPRHWRHHCTHWTDGKDACCRCGTGPATGGPRRGAPAPSSSQLPVTAHGDLGGLPLDDLEDRVCQQADPTARPAYAEHPIQVPEQEGARRSGAAPGRAASERMPARAGRLAPRTSGSHLRLAVRAARETLGPRDPVSR